jgi:large subunit ribosomal protein L23
MNDLYAIIRCPWITEKATLQKEYANQVAFEVDRHANKIEIKRAIEKIFTVRVQAVQTFTVKGKPKKLGRHIGRRKDRKKAIARLYPGEKIEFFEGV